MVEHSPGVTKQGIMDGKATTLHPNHCMYNEVPKNNLIIE